MAVSGSKDFTVTRSQIIEGALRKTGNYDQADAIPGEESSDAAFALNMMVKEWVARGIDIWLREDITVFLQPNTRQYQLGTAHATTSYVETTLTANASASATVLTVGDTTGMTAADNIGVKLNDNSIHWGTIVSVDNPTRVTITAGLASASVSGKKVYAYTTKAGRPQRILYAFRSDTSGQDTEITIVGENEYQSLSNKGSAGPPVEIWYRQSLGTGTLHVWPVDGGSTFDKIVLIAQTIPDDFDSPGDNPQFPVEWANTLVWNLAAELGSEYGLPEREQANLWRVAEFKLNEMLDYDTENASVIFSYDARG